MEQPPVSIAGRIISLYDQGYSHAEIAKELRISKARVVSTLRQAANRAMDSRRIFETHEMVMEILAILRNRSPRTIEKDLPARLGAAIESAVADEHPSGAAGSPRSSPPSMGHAGNSPTARG